MDRRPRRAQIDRLPRYPQGTAAGVVGAEQQAGELGAAGAEQPGQADDLTLADGQGERLDGAGAAQLAGLHERLALPGERPALQPLQVGEFAADHLADQAHLAQLVGEVLPTSLPLRKIVIRSAIS